MPFARKGPRVDQFLWVDTSRRRAGDVADIVRTRSARTEADILDAFDHGHGIAGGDFADLKVGPGRDMRIAAAKTFGEVRDAGELRGFQDPVRNTQPAHIGILIGRHIKQAEKPPTEIVRGFRIFALRGLRFQPFIAIEWMLFALEFLRIGEFAARGKTRFWALSAAASGPTGSAIADAPPIAGDASTALTLLAAFAICRPATKPSRYRFCSGSKSPGC